MTKEKNATKAAAVSAANAPSVNAQTVTEAPKPKEVKDPVLAALQKHGEVRLVNADGGVKIQSNPESIKTLLGMGWKVEAE